MNISALIKRRGLLLVLSSPSGAGKSSIAKRLLETIKDLTLSISATTRKPRLTEENGKDYYFVSNDEFVEMIDNGEFLEHANVFENSYGTLKATVDSAIDMGNDILFDVDWQGADAIQRYGGDDVVSIFILPPSLGELEKRLRLRGQDSNEVVERRMRLAANEISRWTNYNYVIVNNNINRCVAEVEAVLTAERLRRHRQVGLNKYIEDLF